MTRVGSALAELLQKIETGEWKSCSAQPELLHPAEVIPNITKDATDRNRTSPFAFTGNKFEIRMPGSAMNCAGPMAYTHNFPPSLCPLPPSLPPSLPSGEPQPAFCRVNTS